MLRYRLLLMHVKPGASCEPHMPEPTPMMLRNRARSVGALVKRFPCLSGYGTRAALTAVEPGLREISRLIPGCHAVYRDFSEMVHPRGYAAEQMGDRTYGLALYLKPNCGAGVPKILRYTAYYIETVNPDGSGHIVKNMLAQTFENV